MKKNHIISFSLTKKQLSFKIFAVLLFSFVISSTLKGQDVKISLEVKNTPLSTVLNQIETKSGYSFLVRSNDVDLTELVSINVVNKSVNEILAKLFEKNNIKFEVSGKSISIFKPQNLLKQTRSIVGTKKISGIVIESSGIPIIGASIFVKGSSIGAVSNFDGKFSLEVPEQSTLTISYIGFTTKEVKVGLQTNLTISLDEDTKKLDEVIVMGYSSQRKSELSSSAVTLSADKLTDIATSDIGNMLQGKVAGLVVYNSTGQPGSAAEIRIRGTGSITANAEPLYVVDGIPGGSFNPNDVETLTVLKDAGATALYGSAAAGGVIVVTTKSGTRNQATIVNVKATAGMKKNLFGNFKMMESQELFSMHKKLFSPALFSLKRPSSLLHQNFNWQDAFFKSGVQQNYYVSASGSNNQTTYFASLDYYNEDGTLINTGFNKFSGRLNLNTQLYENLDMNIRLSYTNSDVQGASSWTTLNDAYTKMPWDSPYDKDGAIEKITSATRADGTDWYSQDKWNALHNEQYNYNKTNSYELIADFQLNWILTDWLVFSTTNRFNQSTFKNKMFIDPRTYSPEYAKGFLYNQVGMGKSFGTTNTLKSNNKFGAHSLNSLLGIEWGESNNEYTSAAGQGMPNGMDALNASEIYQIGGYSVPLRSYSGFGQVQYSYLSKYFATASLRGDANSKFAPKKRLGWFPSVAASWLISNEDFLKGNENITFLKLRGSYGLTGNSNIGMYEYLASYALSSSYQNVVAAIPTRMSNHYLGWETAYMSSLGLDINIRKNIELNIDVYNTDNKDLLLAVPLSPSTGFFSITSNAGSVRNQGIELQLNTINISTKDFKWDMGFNIGFNKNTVTETPEDGAFLQTRSSVSQEIKRGQDIYSWFMPKWLGVDQSNGNPVWEKIVYDANGDITDRVETSNYKDATFQVVGKATPIFNGGWTNNLTYKGLYVSINTNFVYGNKIFNYNRLALDADGAYLGYNQLSLDNGLGWTRWEKAGDVATHPKLVMNGNNASNSISSRYLEDGSFFRVKNLQFGYDLPSRWLNTMHINRCKVYLSGDNLLTLTKFSGMDPEVTLKTSEYTLAGLYSSNYPIARQFLIGIELGF
jgi:TonB-linked SusC/RagA family outer membrane protein